jgi:uncharacterized protein (TIGR04255 family)
MSAALPVCSGFRIGNPEVSPPEYAHPPLVECWLAIDFVEMRERFDVEAAALRERLGPEWSGSWQAVDDDSTFEDRQLDNVMGDRAVRLTRRGFAFGWLGHQGEHYPRYETIRDGFVATLDAVRDVARPDGLDLTPRRWSVRYVNRIPQGTVWMTPGGWSFFRLWQPVPLKVLGIECGGYKARWELPLAAERGTLTVKFRHGASEATEGIDNVWITLQAKGPTDGGDSGLFDGLDYGREVIGRAFNELVTPDAKAYWGVTHRGRGSDGMHRPRVE